MSEEAKTAKVNNLKDAMALTFSGVTSLNTDEISLSNNSVIVITAAGTIYGTACVNLSNDTDMEGKIFSMIYNSAIEMTRPDTTRYCLVLKNATLVSNESFKQHFNTLFVFPEDIIAITFGDTSKI